MHQTLIIARMEPSHAPDVAAAFAESDAGELPGLLGVAERRLFRFHDLYVHMISSDGPMADRVDAVRSHPAFTEVNSRLARYITAYDPPSWSGPRDAMAQEFYSWSPGRAAGGR
ncbi:MAG: polyketide synthase [Catenulispora sp. 13_1_20CM_3_70_7]|nr:MAG: polyketide synthase [Catenulispora sp. 13_1_20CM_3_70_7]